MEKDWAAVAGAIQTRLRELELTQLELTQRSGLALNTVREIQLDLKRRNRSPHTLAAMSKALEWPESYLWNVLTGQESKPYPDEEHDPVLNKLDDVLAELNQLKDRMATLERQQARGDERS